MVVGKYDTDYEYHIQFLQLRLWHYGNMMTKRSERSVMRSIGIAQTHELDIKQLLDDTLYRIKEEGHTKNLGNIVEMIRFIKRLHA